MIQAVDISAVAKKEHSSCFLEVNSEIFVHFWFVVKFGYQNNYTLNYFIWFKIWYSCWFFFSSSWKLLRWSNILFSEIWLWSGRDIVTGHNKMKWTNWYRTISKRINLKTKREKVKKRTSERQRKTIKEEPEHPRIWMGVHTLSGVNMGCT